MNPGGHSAGVIHVVAGAVTHPDGRVLIAQRPPGKHLAGGWEFPGGKIEAGESRTAGLARELREELGITIRDPRPLMRLRHRYPYGEVLIDMWVVSRYAGEPRGLDGQALRWCTPDELATAELLPADRPIVRALRLPERLTTVSSAYYSLLPVGSQSRTEDQSAVDRPDRHLVGALCSSLDEGAIAAANGTDFVVMRRRVSDRQLAALCESVLVPVFACEMALESAWAIGACGVNELAS